MEYVKKLKILYNLAKALFVTEHSDHVNRSQFIYASGIFNRKKVLEFIGRGSMIESTGKELFELYKEFHALIKSYHVQIKDLKRLMCDCIDFKELDENNFSLEPITSWPNKKDTPDEREEDENTWEFDEIYEAFNALIDEPDILKRIKVTFTERGIWEAYLLSTRFDWTRLGWNCFTADIICQDDWKPKSPLWWQEAELEVDYKIPYPTVVIDGDFAYIHYVCYHQPSNDYLDIHVLAERDGESVSFEQFPVNNKSIRTVCSFNGFTL